MTAREALVDACVPIAAELACVIRDEGPDAVAEVLARVPDGRIDALAVVLAAMVDPERTVADLLAWTNWEPPPPRTGRGGRPPLPREHGSERGYQQHRSTRNLPACEPCQEAHRVEQRDRQRERRRAA